MERQPKVTGMALTAVRVGLAWAMPSAKTNWVLLFYADFSGGEAGFFEGFGEEGVGVFVFVPGVDLGGGGAGERGGFGVHALADAAFFEDGADDERCAGGGEGPAEEALGLAPGEAGEVTQGCSGGDDEGAEFVLMEECAGAVEALFAFG